tara:strand:+ start:402 stop:677 length:276 start_codon:yes stop_codon:yes gene_type:complete
MAELDFESEFYYNLRNRIDKLEIEQKNSIKLIIEHHKPPNMTYNRNGLFLRMADLSTMAIRDIEYLTNLYEQSNKFIKEFKPDLAHYYREL